MVYAARDHYEARIAIPADPSAPPAGSPLYRYIVRRLLDSFDLPRGVLRYYGWMNSPDQDRTVWGVPRPGLGRRTLEREWPKVQGDIDAGHPSPLGLVTVRTPDPRALGRCHQVLAYAYEHDGTSLTLRVYDPNTDPSCADGAWIRIGIAGPARPAAIAHNLAIGDPVRGFFRAAYSPATPPT